MIKIRHIYINDQNNPPYISKVNFYSTMYVRSVTMTAAKIVKKYFVFYKKMKLTKCLLQQNFLCLFPIVYR